MSEDDVAVSLVVGGEEFECSKSLLASSSDYFKQMFSDDFLEAKQNSIELKNFHGGPDIMTMLIKFLKTKELKCNDIYSHLLLLMNCAMLQFTEIQTFCTEEIRKLLSAVNCLDAFRIASFTSLQEVAKDSLIVAAWKFQEVVERETSSFWEQPVEIIEEYLGIHRGLVVGTDGEWAVVEAILQWVQKSTSERKQYLRQLLNVFDYSQLTVSDIDRLLSYEIVEGCDTAKNLLLEIQRQKVYFHKDSRKISISEPVNVHSSISFINAIQSLKTMTKPTLEPSCKIIFVNTSKTISESISKNDLKTTSEPIAKNNLETISNTNLKTISEPILKNDLKTISEPISITSLKTISEPISITSLKTISEPISRTNSNTSLETNISQTSLEREFEKKNPLYMNLVKEANALLCRTSRSMPYFPCVVGFKLDHSFHSKVGDKNVRDFMKFFPLVRSVLYIFDIEKKCIRHVTNLEKLMQGSSLCSGFQACALGPTVYFLGGEYQLGRNLWNNDVWSYQSISQTWRAHDSLPSNRRHHLSCTLNDIIYLVGGTGRYRCQLTSVDAYDSRTGLWSECERVPVSILVGAAICAFKDRILVFTNAEFLTYRPDANKWTVQKLKSAHLLGYHTAVAYGDIIYLLGNSTTKVFKCSPDNPEIIMEIYGSFQHPTLNICLVRNFLFSFTHAQGLQYKEHIVEVLNLDTKAFRQFNRHDKVYYTKEVPSRIVWWENAQGENIFLNNDYSAGYSFGCFPLFWIE